MTRTPALLLAPSLFFLALLGPSRAETWHFQPMGAPAGALQTFAYSISGNGRVVVGEVEFADSAEAFYWTSETGFVLLGDLPGGFVSSWGMSTSADGSVIVGRGTTGPLVGSPTSGIEGFWWSQSTGMLPMGDLPTGSYNSSASSVSADGKIAVGRASVPSAYHAFTWTPAGGMVDLGNVSGQPTQQSEAFDVSGDGSVIVGRLIDNTTLHHRSFRWTPALGMHYLLDGPLLSTGSEAFAVSDDGKYVVGRVSALYVPGNEMFRWSEQHGLERLGPLGEGEALAESISADGSIIVGGVVGIPENSRPFLWDQAHGLRDLQTMLTNDYGLGSALDGWLLRQATGVSADGRTISGWGRNPAGAFEAWVARLVPEPASIGLLAPLALLTIRRPRRSPRGQG